MDPQQHISVWRAEIQYARQKYGQTRISVLRTEIGVWRISVLQTRWRPVCAFTRVQGTHNAFVSMEVCNDISINKI